MMICMGLGHCTLADAGTLADSGTLAVVTETLADARTLDTG
jgi:hypothetical protein